MTTMLNLPRLIPLFVSSLLLAGDAAKPPTPSAPPAPVAVPVAATSAEDDILQIKPVPYHPSLIRDPFKAPTDLENSRQGDLVDDIGVKGRVVSGGKVLVIVSDSRGNIRSLPIGYKFRDGEIVAVDTKAVTFHQWDVNSTNRSVFRTIVRPFKREEGKR
jgi:hypothetical protein